MNSVSGFVKDLIAFHQVLTDAIIGINSPVLSQWWQLAPPPSWSVECLGWTVLLPFYWTFLNCSRPSSFTRIPGFSVSFFVQEAI